MRHATPCRALYLPISPGAIHANPEPTTATASHARPGRRRDAAHPAALRLLGRSRRGGGGRQLDQRPHGQQPPDDRVAETRPRFTEETGIKVNFTVLPENDVRDKISQDFANQAGQYDVATLSNYEIPIYARNGWLHEMDSYVAKDPAYDEQDVLKPMRQSLTGDDGKLYGQPFYGESSFLMYRKDVFAKAGLTMPPTPPGPRWPTWPRRWTAPSPA